MRDGSLAVVALTNRLVDTGVPPLKASELWRLADVAGDLQALLGADASTAGALAAACGLDAGRLHRLLNPGVGLAAELGALEERGVTVVTYLDEPYPARLRRRLAHAAPPVLYVAGDPGLLADDGIGVVGSPNAEAAALEVATTVGAYAAGAGLPVVSGGASGVDGAAMRGAVEAGGTAVGVLADSLAKVVRSAATRRAVLGGQAVLCSPYGPDMPFTASRDAGRSKIVYGLSRATLVVTADDSDGIKAAANEALDHRFGTVAVWRGDGGGRGNAALVDRGGHPVDEAKAVLDLRSVDGSCTDPAT